MEVVPDRGSDDVVVVAWRSNLWEFVDFEVHAYVGDVHFLYYLLIIGLVTSASKPIRSGFPIISRRVPVLRFASRVKSPS